MLLVTHLAPSIIEAAGKEMRTDGIEARGLDENLELIVDRTPRRNHLARSTPELIVRRLVERSQVMRRTYSIQSSRGSNQQVLPADSPYSIIGTWNRSSHDLSTNGSVRSTSRPINGIFSCSSGTWYVVLSCLSHREVYGLTSL